jgi:hypothetical protein
MSRKVLSLLLGAAMLALSSSAFAASITVDGSTMSIQGLGRDTPDFPADYDYLTYSGLSSTFDLAANAAPVSILVNRYQFEVGLNSYNIHDQTGTLNPWTLSIDGMTRSISQDYLIHISYSDTLQVFDAVEPLYFDLGAKGTLLVQPLGFVTAPNAGGPSAWTNMYAEMQLISNSGGPPVTNAVPLPAAAGIGFSMLGSFGILATLRKRLRRTPRIA